MATSYVGFRIWYADGSIRTNHDGTWTELPSTDVQFVTFYEARTYPIWIETDWVTENYCVQLHSHDYYWVGADGEPAAADARGVPDDVPEGSIKTGGWMEAPAFAALAAEASMLRVAP